ncbi:hypothetical protein BMS3Bbin16_00594 [archaeon BMS3Bbin16]|nr:hypothetical protein BMS3Bbin16_00594 [archaeon BMS3Bbin16]
MLSVIGGNKGLTGPLRLVVAAPRSNRVHIPKIGFRRGHKTRVRVAVNLACGGVEKPRPMLLSNSQGDPYSQRICLEDLDGVLGELEG